MLVHSRSLEFPCPFLMEAREFNARPPERFYTAEADAVFNGDGDCLQLSPGSFRCSGERYRMPGITVTRLHLNCGIQLRLPVKDDRLFMVLLDPGPMSMAFSGGTSCGRGSCIAASGAEFSLNMRRTTLAVPSRGALAANGRYVDEPHRLSLRRALARGNGLRLGERESDPGEVVL